MKVLLTGASGFIGSKLCSVLIQEGHDVVGTFKSRNAQIKNITGGNKNLTMIKCDLTKQTDVSKVFAENKFDVIFHMAAFIDTNYNLPDKHFMNNTYATANLLNEAARNGVKKIIYSSTMNVYGKPKHLPVDEKHETNPTNFYGLSKLMGEEICKFYSANFGFNAIVLRYSGVFGRSRNSGVVYNFFKLAKAGTPLILNSNIAWDITHVNDVVQANIKAIKILDRSNFEIINIGSGEKTYIESLAKKIVSITKSRSTVINEAKGDVFKFVYDISKAKKLMGYAPTTVSEALEYYAKEITK